MQAFEFGSVRGLMVVVGMALCLSACEVRPLYGPTTMGIPLADELKAIEIPPIPDRIGHYVRNELIFAFNGTGSETTPARYRLDVKLKERVQSPIIDTVTGRATSATVFMDAEYKLTALATKKEVTSGTLMQIASYDRFSNRLANVRAARDGEIRDAKTIADEIREQDFDGARLPRPVERQGADPAGRAAAAKCPRVPARARRAGRQIGAVF